MIKDSKPVESLLEQTNMKEQPLNPRISWFVRIRLESQDD